MFKKKIVTIRINAAKFILLLRAFPHVRQLESENFDNINKRGLLKIKSVTTDARAQIHKVFANIRRRQTVILRILHVLCINYGMFRSILDTRA